MFETCVCDNLLNLCSWVVYQVWYWVIEKLMYIITATSCRLSLPKQACCKQLWREKVVTRRWQSCAKVTSLMRFGVFERFLRTGFNAATLHRIFALVQRLKVAGQFASWYCWIIMLDMEVHRVYHFSAGVCTIEAVEIQPVANVWRWNLAITCSFTSVVFHGIELFSSLYFLALSKVKCMVRIIRINDRVLLVELGRSDCFYANKSFLVQI